MEKMERIKGMLYTLLQLLLTIVLIVWVSTGGIGMFFGLEFGSKIVQLIITIGISVMAVSGIITSQFLETRRFVLLRNTQLQIFKYLGFLFFFQAIGAGMVHVIGGTTAHVMSQMSPYFKQIMVVGFGFMGIMMPITYAKSMFTEIKAVQFRKPSKIIRQMFK